MNIQSVINEESLETLTSYLSFKLGEEHFAIPVMKVMEILEVPKITKIPRAPEFLKGVINLRGAVLPVIDGRIKFGMSPIEFTIDTSVLVLSILMNDEEVRVGILVNSVLEVFEAEESKIQPSPSIGTKYRAEFIQGMIKENDQFMMLINIDNVFSALELENIIETETIS